MQLKHTVIKVNLLVNSNTLKFVTKNKTYGIINHYVLKVNSLFMY